MPTGTGLMAFAKKYPERFFDVGIAEEHAVTFAAGMAAGGYHPVVAVYSTFLQRAYDQILHDVCINKLPVTFAVDRAGIVGKDGETHQGVFDLSFLAHIPNLTVMAPKSTQLPAIFRWQSVIQGELPKIPMDFLWKKFCMEKLKYWREQIPVLQIRQLHCLLLEIP